jgi:hypothetical protein
MTGDLGRLLVITGIILVIAGFLIATGRGIPFLGRLPGDIRIERDGFTFYFPIATGLLLSLVVTILLRLFRR